MDQDDSSQNDGDASGSGAASTKPVELISDKEVVTAKDLIEVLRELPPETVVSVSIGPVYEDIPMTDAFYWPAHGAIFLMGEELPDDDDDDVIEGDWVEIPRDEPEEYIDTSMADPA